MTVSDELEETEELTYVVLQTVNRKQAKGTTARIVTPRDPEVTDELGMSFGGRIVHDGAKVRTTGPHETVL